MLRNHYLLIGFVWLFILSACSQGIALTESDHHLIISHFLPGSHPIQTDILKGIGDEWTEESNNSITYDLYPSNALGNAGSQYDMAVTGEADIALSVHGYSPGRFPLVSILELPFFAESAVHGSKIIEHLFNEFPSIQKQHDDSVPLFLFTADPAQLVTKTKRIKSPEDVKGLRIRSPSPLANEILEALGAVPVSMPMGDVYESMERGVIDGAMIPLEALYNYNLHEVTNYITIGNFSTTPFFAVMNKHKYEQFSKSEKSMIHESTGLEAAIKSGQVFDQDGRKGRNLAEESGAKVYEVDKNQIGEWNAALKPVFETWIEEMEKEGYPGREIYRRALELKEELR
ncbi:MULTISPECIES: TRAP transporter substrate-binding protein [Virgibacillus]|uniref:2,3-diketo-L-gulonate-binding periplasmic protein YiaO n=1 Tax=Virgibacillus dokdonensis TaxID=302167 RepID=A0A2K9J4T7_9BACI|nr:MULTISPECIES: TRAP transporter substrate-binding protein [Virgibacillus]AUJ26972.1 2,3-diketo-L-gulonate-binding periplasmic protein YiaO precursor [Virgibacillus dokdonensis]NWO14721.1 TRAP transporter substrate-binding protein [Virgibacillus sp.]